MRHAFAILFIISATLGVVNAFDPPPTHAPLSRYEFTQPHMGTTFRIVLYAPSDDIAKKASAAAFARVAELNRIMSDYVDDSELMKLCKKPGEWVPVSDDLFKILTQAEELSKASDGAFDTTIGPVVRLWRRARRSGEMPPADTLKKALALVDYRNVELDATTKSVRLRVSGILLDLGGIAKGYAAAAALEVLRRHGITRALVAGGGDIVVAESPPDSAGWKVAVDAPGQPQPLTLLLSHASVSTSGDANQFVTIAGKRYSHIIDPKTGLGLTGRRAVTVVAINGAHADGYTSAASILGVAKGLKMIEANPNLAVRFVEVGEKATATMSSRFQQHVTRSGPSRPGE